MLDNNGKALLTLVRAAIGHNVDAGNAMTGAAWPEICKLAQRQGVIGIAWDGFEQLHKDGIIHNEDLPSKSIRLQWALNTEHIAKRYRKQEKIATELAESFARDNIATFVLKGLAISQYYPISEHRECGDLDCFLTKLDQSHSTIMVNDAGLPICLYNEGNEIAKRIGAVVDVDFYKHSHINYKGLMIENHAFCTGIRGSKQRKAFERYIERLLASRSYSRIGNSALLSPSADFNALFLTAHSFQHFLTEGIKLRHVLDWALLIQAEQDNIDWKSFYEWCDKMHFSKFADALTAISIKYLGITITNGQVRLNSSLADRVLEDILYGDKSVHNSNASKHRKRMMIIRNRLSGGWKYSEVYERSALLDTLQLISAFFIERTPKL